MTEDGLGYLHKTHSDAQNKYIYFLLAVTASAIAFAVQKTESAILSWSLMPLGLAVMFWCLSFYFGCKNLVWVQTSVGANYSLLQLRSGVHQDQPSTPQLTQTAMQVVSKTIQYNINKAAFYEIWQSRLLIGGAILFLIWHILGIILRTYPR